MNLRLKGEPLANRIRRCGLLSVMVWLLSGGCGDEHTRAIRDTARRDLEPGAGEVVREDVGLPSGRLLDLPTAHSAYVRVTGRKPSGPEDLFGSASAEVRATFINDTSNSVSKVRVSDAGGINPAELYAQVADAIGGKLLETPFQSPAGRVWALRLEDVLTAVSPGLQENGYNESESLVLRAFQEFLGVGSIGTSCDCASMEGESLTGCVKACITWIEHERHSAAFRAGLIITFSAGPFLPVPISPAGGDRVSDECTLPSGIALRTVNSARDDAGIVIEVVQRQGQDVVLYDLPGLPRTMVFMDDPIQDGPYGWHVWLSVGSTRALVYLDAKGLPSFYYLPD